jgi:hypothetical protein
MMRCAKRTVLLTGPKGDKIELVADPPSGSGGSVQQLYVSLWRISGWSVGI